MKRKFEETDLEVNYVCRRCGENSIIINEEGKRECLNCGYEK